VEEPFLSIGSADSGNPNRNEAAISLQENGVLYAGRSEML
jgi:hypothetical protein